MSAARSARVICGAWSIARYSAGSSAQRRSRAHRVEPRLDGRVRLDGQRRRCRPSRASSNRRALRGSRRSAPASPRRVGSSATALRKCSSARVVVALLPLDAGQLAIQERAVGRARDRRQVRLRSHRPGGRLAPPARARAMSLLDAAEPQDFDAARRDRSATDRRRARLRTRRARRPRDSGRAAPGRGRRAPRHRRVCGLSSSARSKCASAAFGVLPRQLDVAERGFGRIERRARPSAPPANSRSALLQIAGLQKRPAARFADARQRRAGQRRRHRRPHELGELRRRHDRRGRTLRRARADATRPRPSRHRRIPENFIPRSQAVHGSYVCPSHADAAGAERRRRSTPGRRASRASTTRPWR